MLRPDFDLDAFAYGPCLRQQGLLLRSDPRLVSSPGASGHSGAISEAELALADCGAEGLEPGRPPQSLPIAARSSPSASSAEASSQSGAAAAVSSPGSTLVPVP